MPNTYPFVKGLRCSLFDCTRIPFVKDCTCKCLLSRLFAVGLFFLSKNGSETFCQGFLLQAFSFCQRMAQKPFVKVLCCRPFLFVKEWLRNLLSRFFAAGHFFLSKNGSETFCQGLCPFVKGSKVDAFKSHTWPKRHPLLHRGWTIHTWGSW